MASILKAVCSRLSDDELLEKFDWLKVNIWNSVNIDPENFEEASELCKQIQEYRKKLSWMMVILGERGLGCDDDGLLEYCKSRLIDISKDYGICPLEYDETFESLGVKDPWTFKGEISVIDLEFQAKKDRMKKYGILFIKQNPTCNRTDLETYLDNNFSEEDAALGKFLMIQYQNWAYKRELVSNNTFEDFRDFIVNTPIEVLESL